MAPEKRRLLSYALLIATIAIGAGMLATASAHSNRPFHTNISTISAMVSMFAGLLSIVRYYAKRSCPYLWIGLAFVGNSFIEIIYVYHYSFFPYFKNHNLENLMVCGWWAGRMYLSSMLLGSFLTCRETPVVSIKLAYAVGIPLWIALVAMLLLFNNYITIFPFIIPRPLELIPGVLFAITLVGYFRQEKWKAAEFYHWLILSLIVVTTVQLAIIPFSGVVYDIRFLYANILRAVAHLFVSIGVLAEVFKLYQNAQDETRRLVVLRLMVNQIKDYALFMMDTGGQILSWNRGAEFIKGYRAEEIIGKHFSKFYPDEDNEAGKPAMELREAVKQGHYIDEGWRIKKDGSRFWAYVLITPIYSENGELLGFAKVTRDLTERKMAEEELRRKNERLTQSIEELEQFAYIATHDLKEPLRSISSFTELLVRDCKNTNERSLTYSDIVIRAVKRLSKLIDDLRTYNIVGKQGAEDREVDMSQCLQDAIILLKKKIDESAAVINSEKLPIVRGSQSQFTYIFLHLLDNAIKYAKPGLTPVIDISCVETVIECTFSIADNGVGIPKEYEDKIFTIFKKLMSREKTEGSGIGLSICRKVILLYGGHIWFQANDSGTTFYFTLPKTQVHAPSSPALSMPERDRTY